MWIREAKEDLRQLAFVKEVGEEFHCVGAKTGNILVQWRVRISIPESLDAVLHILCDLRPYLETCSKLSETSYDDVGRTSIPRRSSSGSLEARATSRPPNPQPMSATVTSLLIRCVGGVGKPSGSF